MAGSNTLSMLVFVPVSVSVRLPFPEVLKGFAEVNPKEPTPMFSIVAPFTPTTNLRVVVVAAPVYRSVPPSITRFEAALAELPIPLAAPPDTMLSVLNTPPLIVVTPPYVFAAARTTVPAVLVSVSPTEPPEPASTAPTRPCDIV